MNDGNTGISAQLWRVKAGDLRSRPPQHQPTCMSSTKKVSSCFADRTRISILNQKLKFANHFTDNVDCLDHWFLGSTPGCKGYKLPCRVFNHGYIPDIIPAAHPSRYFWSARLLAHRYGVLWLPAVGFYEWRHVLCTIWPFLGTLKVVNMKSSYVNITGQIRSKWP